MNLPKAFRSEYELKRHVERVLSKDTDCHRNLNFLGAGCWQHYVPAICDEINGKGEFLTAYGGEPYNDEGRFQSLFEYASMVAELVDMEVVNVPTMDWGAGGRHDGQDGSADYEPFRSPGSGVYRCRKAENHGKLCRVMPPF